MMRESLQQYDDGPLAAAYGASARNPYFGEWIRGFLAVRVERQLGRRPLRWLAAVEMELPDEERTSWIERVVCDTQDNAAEEAAAMLVVARPLFVAALRGDRVETPGQRCGRAAEAHVDASPEYVAALRTLRDELPEDSDRHPEAHRRWLDVRAETESLRRREIDVFREAHGWREFM
jgi:hypothetical protein